MGEMANENHPEALDIKEYLMTVQNSIMRFAFSVVSIVVQYYIFPIFYGLKQLILQEDRS